MDIELRIGDEEHIGGVVAADGIERIVGFAHLAVCKLLRAETVSRLRDAGGGVAVITGGLELRDGVFVIGVVVILLRFQRVDAQKLRRAVFILAKLCENFGRLVVLAVFDELKRLRIVGGVNLREKVFIGDILKIGECLFFVALFVERDALITECGLHFLILLRVDFFKMRGGGL